MPIIKIQQGESSSSISVFREQPLRKVHKAKRNKSLDDKNSSSIAKKSVSPYLSVKRRNQNLLSVIQTIKPKHQGFITLLYNTSNANDFRKSFDKFTLWFKRKYSNGWMFYNFELCSNGNIHVHCLAHSGMDDFNISLFEEKARRKWAVINSDGNPSLTMVTPYHEAQRYYFTKRDKASDIVKLATVFQNANTYGFIGKANIQFIEPSYHQVDEKIVKYIQEICLKRVSLYDHATKRKPSWGQLNRIISGSFCQHGIPDQDESPSVSMPMINYYVYFDELAKIYPVAPEGMFDTLPEWPGMIQQD